jgi:hypothetical protein
MSRMSNLVSLHLEMVLVLVQDRCAVCAKHTIGSEMILDAPNEACFGPFGDGVSISSREVQWYS